MKLKKNEEVVTSINDSAVENEVENEQVSNKSVASTEKLQLANRLLARVFNIDDSYVVTGVVDTGKSLKMSFANHYFEVSVKIKNTEEIGISTKSE